MNRRAIGISLIAILALMLPAAASQQSDSTRQSDATTKQSDSSTSQGVSSSDRKFIMEVAHNGMAEVELAKLALQRASSDEVKQYAQRLADDHTRANEELMQLAKSKGVTMPADAHHSQPSQMTQGDTTRQTSDTQTTGQTTTGSTTSSSSTSQTSGDTMKSHDMGKKHHAMTQKLSGLSGEEFDREYIKGMVKDHEKAVSLFQKQASKGDDAEVKAWAAKTLPTLQEHLRMARDIAAKHKTKKTDSGSR